MAIDEGDQADSGGFSTGNESAPESDTERSHQPTRHSDSRVGEYTWADFMEEYGYGDEVNAVYPHGREGHDDQLGIETDEDVTSRVPTGDDWEKVSFDPRSYLGYDPDDVPTHITDVFAPNAKFLHESFLEFVDPDTTPVRKDVYLWEHYKWEYYYDETGDRPRDTEGEIDRFDRESALGFDPEDIREKLYEGGAAAMELDDVIDDRTVNVRDELDEDEFFSTVNGHTTVTNRYDLEKAVPLAKKLHFNEVERYWVHKPYSFVIIFHSDKENEKKYYVIEPHFNEIESELQEFLSGKLRTAIKYSDEDIKNITDEGGRREVIEDETRRLLKRYDLFEQSSGSKEAGLLETIRTLLDDESEPDDAQSPETQNQLDGIEVRPEPVVLEEDGDTLNEYQVEKLLYQLKRNFIGYERIDGIKHDINVEDISVDGYNSPVFVYHSEYEQIISNIYHGENELDDFVVKLAQRSGKGISKRMPQVDATLPDGSRAQLTLGREVSDHGTNYTIRQFKDVPFTPIDLINWNTFSLDEMAFLWLSIENHKSLIFAGGTASGKTTSLNAVSLFIPSNTKIVSIEDTREVELPQRNWIASITRPSFNDDAQGDVDEFDLLEAALRQRPDYIVMGEIRGEEGRTLFQVMSTGHTTYTTFHADSVDEVLKRFTTDPINVSKTMFTALDLVSIQTQTRVQGSKVRRNKSLTEINHYEAEHDEINVQDIYQWQAETDEYLKMGDSNTLDEIKFDRGWSNEKLQDELFKRKVILAYLIKNELNTYAHVAATVQAFINDPDTILTLIANGQLESSLEDLREMESVLIDVDPEKEALVPRPDPTNETFNLSMDILERAEESLFDQYRGDVPSGLTNAFGEVQEADTIHVDSSTDEKYDFDTDTPAVGESEDWGEETETAEFSFETDSGTVGDSPSWLEDGDDFTIDEGATASQPQTAEEKSAEQQATADTSTASAVDSSVEESSGAVGETGTTSNGESGHDARQPSPSTEPEPKSTEPEPKSTEPDPKSTETHPATGSSRVEQTRETDQAQPKSASSESTSKSSTEEDSKESEGGIDELFSDMDQTLEDLESAEPPSESTSVENTVRESDIDTSNFDSMFPERNLDSIFGSDDSSGSSPQSQSSSQSAPAGASKSEGTRDERSDEGSIFGGESGTLFSDDTEQSPPVDETKRSDGDGSDSIFSDDPASSPGDESEPLVDIDPAEPDAEEVADSSTDEEETE